MALLHFLPRFLDDPAMTDTIDALTGCQTLGSCRFLQEDAFPLRVDVVL